MRIEKRETTNRKSDSGESGSISPLRHFEKSMEIDYEKWHDGIGYDLDAIKSASQTERKVIEQILIHHNPRDWRDIEALAQIDTEDARETIKNAIKDPDPAVRVAVTRYAPNLVTNSERSHSIIEALQHAKIFGGLSQVLDDIEEYHPVEVKDALIKGLLRREGDVAVLFAAMLFYLYGKAKEPFDMKQRPFFLLFNTEDKEKRLKAFRELCKQLSINPEKYLA
jgi:HEAT repeat protein